MHRHAWFASLLLCMTFAGAARAELIAPQSKPWRVGIAGGWTVGYLGVLAHHGMPAERILEEEVTNPARLANYDCVILGERNGRDASAWKPLEDYVRAGGCLVSETMPYPSETAIPGQRLKPGRVPNIRFEDAISPITQGLDYRTLIPMATRGGCSIIPEPGSGTVVLARYTYDGIDGKTRERVDGHFLDEDDGKYKGRGAPAILMRHVDKGILVYSCCPIGFSLSLRGEEFAGLLINLLQYLSKGEIHDRFYTGAVEKDDLLTANLSAYEPSLDPPTPATAVSAPEGYEALDEAMAEAQDFWVLGTVPPEAQAEVLFSYRGPGEYLGVGITPDGVSILAARGGARRTVATRAVAGGISSGAELRVRRVGDLVICYLNGQPVLHATPGPATAGAVLSRHLEDAACQPCAEVLFADDFMREQGSQNEWETVSGQWKDVVVEGEAEKGANPFKYQGSSTERAIATAGYWFWGDYKYRAAVHGAAKAAGIAFYYQDPDNYHLLRVSYAQSPSAQSLLELVRRAAGKDEVLASRPVSVGKDQWCAMQVRASGSHIIGSLDGVPLLQVRDESAGAGCVGMYAEAGAAIFDDVDVSPWLASYEPGSDPSAAWLIESGEWTHSGDELIAGAGKAMLAFKPCADASVRVPIKLGDAQAAGVYIRDHGEGRYLAALVRQNPNVVARLFCADGERSEVIAEKPIPGGPDQWHELTVTADGPLITMAVDGKPIVRTVDSGPRIGCIGLYARGNVPAHFRPPVARQLLETEQMVDGLMPAFAGIIDRHTWAGRPGAWHPQHDVLNRFWHHGYFPGPVSLVAGIHPLGKEQTRTHLYLTSEQDTAAGYQLTANRVWGQNSVALRLLYQGKEIASATAPVEPKQPYLLALKRDGNCVWAEVDGRVAAASNTQTPSAELCRLGVDNEGAPLMAEDLAVYTPWARNYTFTDAPTDWIVHSGNWDTTNRWSCSPQWTWYCGYNGSGPAQVSGKVAFKGDMDLSFYVGARMMPRGDGKFYEQLRDVHIGICCGPNGAADGYLLKVSNLGQYTVLERKGKEVKRSTFTIPQVTIHNDWLQLGIRKRGATIQLLHWGYPVMEYTDPNPLDEGTVCLGTDRNGILVPRMTVYGEVINPLPDPLALPTG